VEKKGRWLLGLIDTKHNTASIFEDLFQIRPVIRYFQSLPFFAKSAELNIVAENTE
jgi:hypothetical protein